MLDRTGGVSMRVEQAQLTMNASSVKKIEQRETSELRFWTGKQPATEHVDAVGRVTQAKAGESGFTAGDLSTVNAFDQFDISRQGLEFSYNVSAAQESEAAGEINYEISHEDKFKIKLIEKFLRKLTGKDVNLRIPIKIRLARPANVDLPSASQASSSSQQPQAEQGWGLEINAARVTRESASFNFTSTGVVKTDDGQEISFSLNVQASREFMEKTTFNLRAGDAAVKDPLVISLDGNLPEISSQTFSFDLDSDGVEDQISRLTSGSGFLVLDIGADGQITSGRELFGTASGDGFADLAAYDSDSNNWIDEADPVFSQLRIWEQNDNGSSTLLALGEAGIGAIYLGHMDGAFDLKDDSNALLGRIQSSGLYLREDGQAGSAHQIDLVM